MPLKDRLWSSKWQVTTRLHSRGCQIESRPQKTACSRFKWYLMYYSSLFPYQTNCFWVERFDTCLPNWKKTFLIENTCFCIFLHLLKSIETPFDILKKSPKDSDKLWIIQPTLWWILSSNVSFFWKLFQSSFWGFWWGIDVVDRGFYTRNRWQRWQIQNGPSLSSPFNGLESTVAGVCWS